jgi:hypothetical protein
METSARSEKRYVRGRQIKIKGEINWAKSKHLRRKSIRLGRTNARGREVWMARSLGKRKVLPIFVGQRGTSRLDTLRGAVASYIPWNKRTGHDDHELIPCFC